MNVWKRYLPISFGLILSIGAVIFILEAVRGLDFDGFGYNFYPLMNILCGLVLGLVGFPIVLSQLEKFSQDD